MDVPGRVEKEFDPVRVASAAVYSYQYLGEQFQFSIP
jgi:hypothetical protein